MIYKILILQIIVFLSFARAGIGNTTYHDIYGNDIQKIEKSANKITILYFDVADDDTEFTQIGLVEMRLKQMAVGFERWKEVCTIIVITPSKSLLPDRIRHLLTTNQDIYVNKSDELWSKYHRGPVPAAMVDFTPEWYVPFVSSSVEQASSLLKVEHAASLLKEDPDGVRTFQHLFLPNGNSRMAEILKSAITRRLTESRKEGDSLFEDGKADEAKASYSVAQSWLDHLSNPVEGFDPQELARGYLQLGNNYIRIAESTRTQSNPQVLKNVEHAASLFEDEDYSESQYLEEATKCLEKALRHASNKVEQASSLLKVEHAASLFKAAEALYAGLTYERQDKLGDARISFKNALLIEPDWTEVEFCLMRVEEKIRRILLCIQLEASFYDDLPEKETGFFPNRFEQLLLDELIRRGYRVRIVPSDRKEEFHKLMEQNRESRLPYVNQNGRELILGRIIYGKVTLTIRRFRPKSFNLIAVEGSIQINAAYLGSAGPLDILATIDWNGKASGTGETDSRAVVNFFQENSDSLKEELGRFLDKHSEPEEYISKKTQG